VAQDELVLKLKILSLLKDILLEDVARHYVHFLLDTDRLFFFLLTLYRTKFGGVYPKRAFIVQLCVAIEAGGVHAN
jgi:hypothetical protein